MYIVKYMDKLKINTPQNVQIEYRIASVGTRMLAILIDFAVMMAYVVFNTYILSKINFDESWTYIAVTMLVNFPVIFYFFYMETIFQGQTLGKKVMNLKVIRIDGNKASIYEYFIRWIFTIVDILMMSGVIGLLSMVMTKKTQRLGDLAANTTVISLKSQLNIQETVLEELTQERQIVYPQVRFLSDQDVNLIKKNYHYALAKKDEQVLIALRDHLVKLLNIEEVKSSPSEFIQVLLEDHYQLYKDI